MKAKYITKAELISIINNNRLVKFRFRKKDGTIRELNGTLNFNIIPISSFPKVLPAEIIETSLQDKTKLEYFKIFDVELGKWRSIRYDSIIDAQTTELKIIVNNYVMKRE